MPLKQLMGSLDAPPLHVVEQCSPRASVLSSRQSPFGPPHASPEPCSEHDAEQSAAPSAGKPQVLQPVGAAQSVHNSHNPVAPLSKLQNDMLEHGEAAEHWVSTTAAATSHHRRPVSPPLQAVTSPRGLTS
jgi:hypothetical protein